MQTKRCPRCGRELPTSEFNKNASNPDGLQYNCKKCQHEIYFAKKLAGSIKVYDTETQKKINSAMAAQKTVPPAKPVIPEPNPVEKTKLCPKCGKEKPYSEFYKDSRSKDGYYYICKKCYKEYEKTLPNRYKKRNTEPMKQTFDKVVKEPEAVFIAPEKPVPTLKSYSVDELSNELKGRGVTVLINPTPRDLMMKLKEKGYTGVLEYYEKRTINLNANF